MNQTLKIGITASGNLPDFRQAAVEAPRVLGKHLRQAMHRANQQVIAKTVRKRFLGGGPFPASENKLGHRSRVLGRSIRSSYPSGGLGSITSTMGSHVKYFGIHEFGGTTKPRVIRAKNGRALAFNIGGQTVLVKSVNHPGSKYPARRPLGTGIDENRAEYQAEFDAAVEQTLSETL